MKQHQLQQLRQQAQLDHARRKADENEERFDQLFDAIPAVTETNDEE